VYADTLLAAERGHLLRLALWGALSVVVGTGVWGVLAVRRVRSPLLLNFAIQTGAWGAVDLAICAAAWRTLRLRDLAGAIALDRFLWFNIGLDAGYVAVGATLAIVGWRLTRSLALVGAGIGIIVQGSALAVLDLLLASLITRG
jgi:hypothetical protein